MRGWSALNRPLAAGSLAQARALFERALLLDPDLPKALTGLAWGLAAAAASHVTSTPADDLARADDAVARVIARFPDHAMAHFVRGEILTTRKEFEPAIGEYEAAIASNRDLAPAYAATGRALVRAGRAEEALAPLETAIRLSPRDPLLNIWYFYIGHVHTHLAHDDDAIEWCRRSVALAPYWVAYVDLASAYAWTGRDAEARAAVAKLLEMKPGYTIERWEHEGWSDNPTFLAQYDRITQGLRKAGLPEG
jgi:adenylate cyclase